jgi:hypothetical protein
MEICPLEPAWGNLAEWAGVVVAALVGYAVFKLTHAANETNRRVAQLQLMADEREARTQDQERRGLLVTLERPLMMSLTYVALLEQELSEKLKDEAFWFQLDLDPSYREHMHQRIAATELQLRDYVRDRLHVIGDPVASRIMRIDGFATLLSNAIMPGEGDSTDNAVEEMEIARNGLRRIKIDLEFVLPFCQAAILEAGIEISPPEESPGEGVGQASS